MARRSLGIQTIQLALAMGVAQVLTAIGFAIAARATEPGPYGVVVAAIGVALVIGGIVDFGQNSFLVREVAGSRIDRATMIRRLAQKVVVAAIVGGVVTAIAVVIAAPYGQIGLVVVTFALALLTLASLAAQVPLRAAARSGAVALASVVDRTLFIIVVTALALAGAPAAVTLPIGLAVGLTANTLTCLLHDRAALALLRGGLGGFRGLLSAWRGTRGYGAAAVLGSAQQLDTALLGVAGGAVAAGHYGAVSRWTNPLILPSTALTQAGVVYAAEAASVREVFASMRRSLWLIAVGVLACVVTAAIAPFVTPIILGDAYADSAPVLAILAIAVIPTLVAQPVSMVLQARGRDGSVAIVLAIGLALRLGTAVLLGAGLGALGAAFGVMLQQLVIALALVAIVVLVHRREARPQPESTE